MPVLSSCISALNMARYLGVVLDRQLSLNDRVVCLTCCYQLCQLCTIARSLSHDTPKTLVHAFISSRLDYCNSLLFGITDGLMSRLQSVRNAAARLVSGARRCDIITPVLRQRHWLLIRSRVEFRFAKLVFQSMSGTAPFGLCAHLYADDTQIYGSCRAQSTTTLADALSRCTSTVADWMLVNRLQLNAGKTDVLWCASVRRSSSLPSDPLLIAGAQVRPVSTVRDLGVLVDSDLGAASHVRMVVSRCFAALRQLRQLRRYVSDECFQSLVHSRLDYGNFILVGLPLQHIVSAC